MEPFNLRMPLEQVKNWACRYPCDEDSEVIDVVAPQATGRGWLTKSEFMVLSDWKSKRVRSRSQMNSEEIIRCVTQTALSTECEELRIRVLTLLQGVSWPMASVILHFLHRDPYPILDFRALWSLGIDKPPEYNFDFWRSYTQFTRDTTAKCGVTMRELDRALWQFSKENQPKG